MVTRSGECVTTHFQRGFFGATRVFRKSGHAFCGPGGARRERPAAGAGARRRAATRRFRHRSRQRRRLGRRTRGAQLAKRTHRAAWPYSRARGSAAAAASPRGPSDPPRGGSCSRRRRRGRGRCSGRRGGEGSGGGVGRRARAPQRGRRVALPAPAAAPWAPVADWRSGARDGRTGSGAFDAGRCVRHSDVAHRSVGCIREQPCTCCDCHWRRSGHMHRALVAAAAGRRQTASGPARGRAIFCTRESAADAFGAHAHARFPSQDDDDATPLQRSVTLFPEPSVPGLVRS